MATHLPLLTAHFSRPTTGSLFPQFCLNKLANFRHSFHPFDFHVSNSNQAILQILFSTPSRFFPLSYPV